MELKKNPKFDLSRQSGLFFNMSLAFVLLLVNTAFEWRTTSDPGLIDLSDMDAKNGRIELFEQAPTAPAIPLPPSELQKNAQPFPKAPSGDEEEIMIEVKLDISLEGGDFDNSFLDQLSPKS